MTTTEKHTHEWMPVGITKEDHIFYSPVSVMDHQIQLIEYAVQSCKCGAVKKTIVGRGKVRWLNQ